MSIAHEQKAIGPPRALIRAFCAIHKSIVRLSCGRIGLWRPGAGKRFGVLALETFGRRSGREHSVIIGYFEEGPDLVTLAMNGWADSEPAWWLNLQARPDATVLLATGPRAVHARAADGRAHEVVSQGGRLPRVGSQHR